jgi:hypothetical protein
MLKSALNRWNPWRFSQCLLATGIMLGLTSGLQPVPVQAQSCDFPRANGDRTTKYGIFGDAEFQTAVCGHLVTRTETIWDQPTKMAYLRITKFRDEGFRQAIQAGIKQGNGVNALRDGQYEFNLGCFSNGKVYGEQFPNSPVYMTADVQAGLKQSSAQRPIVLMLGFGKHAGAHCDCCNLAHTVRLAN